MFGYVAQSAMSEFRAFPPAYSNTSIIANEKKHHIYPFSLVVLTYTEIQKLHPCRQKVSPRLSEAYTHVRIRVQVYLSNTVSKYSENDSGETGKYDTV